MERKQSFRAALAAFAAAAWCVPAFAVVQGIDVSNHQGAINWASVKAGGIQFAFCKATEGVDFVDARFTSNMANASAAGVLIGPYHFARPDSNSSNPLDAVLEADDFVDAIAPYYNNPNALYLRPVLDVERFLDLSTIAQERAYLSEWIRDFNGRVEERLGVSPLIYCNGNYAQTYFEADIAQYDLWFAKPTSTNSYASASPPTAANIGIWDEWKFWQWTWTGSVGGINPVDRNVFAGEMVDLAEYIVGFDQGDYNKNGTVDAADYTLWRNTIGQNVLPGRGADGNLNGVIDAGDFEIWRAKFGMVSTGAAAAVSAVPEPITMLLLLPAAISIALVRQLSICRRWFPPLLTAAARRTAARRRNGLRCRPSPTGATRRGSSAPCDR